MTGVLARCTGLLPDQPFREQRDPPLQVLVLVLGTALVVAVAIALATWKDPA